MRLTTYKQAQSIGNQQVASCHNDHYQTMTCKRGMDQTAHCLQPSGSPFTIQIRGGQGGNPRSQARSGHIGIYP
jgi:hypothetical protein